MISPTLKYNEANGQRYTVSIDENEEQVINFNQKQTDSEWRKRVANKTNQSVPIHKIVNPGLHSIRYRVLGAGVVLQQLGLDMGGAKPSYLGIPKCTDLFNL